MSGVSPKLPLQHAPSEGYSLIKTMPDLIRQNLRHLLLTNPGERIMDPTFGVGIKKYLFEPNIGSVHQGLETNISKQIKKYMPFLNIENINIIRDIEDGNAMYVTISYLISPLNQLDRLNLEIRK